MRIAWVAIGASVAVATAGCGASPVAEVGSSSSVVRSSQVPMRWVSSYGVEVEVPKAWRPGALSPNEACVRGGVETRVPYVEVGQFDAVSEAMLCRPTGPTDIPSAFGQLAFRLWQPHVALRRAGGVPDEAPGTWTYRGWTLQRATVGRLSISVLTDASHGGPGLGARVIGSARTVAVDALGCASVAPGRLARMRPPAGRPLPVAAKVGSISVCEYDRTRPGPPRLAADVSIAGSTARAIVTAIHAAPLGGGPDRPRDCLTSMHGDEALVLHFVRRDGRPGAEDPQAFVYADWCVGNGIVEAGGRHVLTRKDCRPLFAEPPVVSVSAQQNIAPLCGTE